MGFVLSYRAGAWKMMRAVPMRQAHVNIHRNSLSKTMATYCQSSMICGKQNEKKNIGILEHLRIPKSSELEMTISNTSH